MTATALEKITLSRNIKSIAKSSISSNINSNDVESWALTLGTRSQSCNFFMFHYKVHSCQHGKQCQAVRKVTCAGYHHERERRRSPGSPPQFAYCEDPCPKLTTK